MRGAGRTLLAMNDTPGTDASFAWDRGVMKGDAARISYTYVQRVQGRHMYADGKLRR